MQLMVGSWKTVRMLHLDHLEHGGAAPRAQVDGIAVRLRAGLYVLERRDVALRQVHHMAAGSGTLTLSMQARGKGGAGYICQQ